ncbi:unnamed protein product [marine sediment metagenome]|uniref:Uncharacterized protein n=1 Tax=marine sediment metagenome TaxID=412755 RepID=X1RU21_9ZZZZ
MARPDFIPEADCYYSTKVSGTDSFDYRIPVRADIFNFIKVRDYP